MPAPSAETFSTAAKVAAQTSLRDQFDSGSGPAVLEALSSADVVLLAVTLSDPSGTINSGTGVLTVTMPTATVNAAATGAIAWGRIRDSNNNVHWSAPAAAGTSAVAGQLVVNTLSAVAGQPITVMSIVFNPPA